MSLKIATTPSDSTTVMRRDSIVPEIPFKLNTKTTHLVLAQAAVNHYFHSAAFKNDLAGYSAGTDMRFEMADITPNDFVVVLCDALAFLPVVHIRIKWMMYKNVYASVYSNQPFAMYLNSRNLTRYRNDQRNIASLAGTIAHEFIHILDAYSPKSFGHGDNSSRGKQRTLPYWIGNKVQEYVLEQYGITKEVL